MSTRCLKYRLFLVILLLGSLVQTGFAEDKYITAQLKVGLHSDAALDSPVLELIEANDKVTELESKNGYSKVRTAGNQTGWIKSDLLATEEPLKVQYEKLEQKLKEQNEDNTALNKKLENLSRQLEIFTSDNTGDAEILELKQAYEEQVAALKEKMSALENQQDEVHEYKENPDTALLREENQRLKDNLLAIASIANDGKSELPVNLGLTELKFSAVKDQSLLMIAGVGLLSFLAGLFLMWILKRDAWGNYTINR